MKRVSPTVIEVDLEAIRHNYKQLRKRYPASAKTLCVVKSNAYGHGAGRVAKVLQEEGSDWFGTGTVDEGLELRESGVKKPILLLMGMIEGHPSCTLRYQLTPVVYEISEAEKLHEFLAHSKRKLPIHIKVDTGMSRLGVLPREFGAFCDRLRPLTSLDPVGLMTHFSDVANAEWTTKQTKLFDAAKTIFLEKFPGPKVFHMANTQAAIEGKVGMGDSDWMVRLGISLYGAYPLEKDKKLVDLQPALTLKSKVISVKKIPAKTPVSYLRSYVTKKDSVIGVIPVGYADGYPRCLSNEAHVLIRGKRVPVIGIVTMDMIMVDLTSLPNAKVGEEVVLIGTQAKEEIRVEEVAKWADTISYEILSRLSPRIPRVYI